MADFATEVARFWPAFDAAGMLETATDDDGEFKVAYQAPGRFANDGRQSSNDHEIEYQHADRPNLAEGAELSIDPVPHGTTGNFKVRQAPFIRDTGGNAAEGTFRCALLTEVR